MATVKISTTLGDIVVKLYDETPLVGLTFKKVDANTGAQLYNGAKFNCYYYENNDPTGNRVYLGVFYYKTNVSKNKNYEVYTYTDASGKEHKYNIFPNGFPNSKTYLTQGQDGTKFVPAFAAPNLIYESTFLIE